MSSQRVRLELRERFALLRLALPRGLVDARALEELESTCSELATSLDLRALIVTGWQGVFACGWSPGLLADARAGAGSLSQAFSPLARLPVPVICAINGDAISAGLELALACDIRLAAEEARFALPEVQQGRLPMGGGSQRLSRTVGRGKAAWLLLTGEAIDATEALR
ncbi:MAG TPA: enoyl-CoA hydratase/isomerase family protein, partial [Dehalococcoidia bacterium]|nr:enoyl-CoA hydratase/isomerase family protein [Dehalococcoidia bacterium]